jgi:hypothetical protein
VLFLLGQGPAPSDHWLNIVLGVAGILTGVAVVFGAAFTLRYGRVASVSVTATPKLIHEGILVVVRPSIKAAGVLAVKMFRGRGSLVTVAEVIQAGNAINLQTSIETENVFEDSFVVGGEELLTTTIVPMPRLSEALLGWSVELKVYAPNRILRFDLLGRFVRIRPMRWFWQTTRVGRLVRSVGRLVTWRGLRQYLRNLIFVPPWVWNDQIFVGRDSLRED